MIASSMLDSPVLSVALKGHHGWDSLSYMSNKLANSPVLKLNDVKMLHLQNICVTVAA